MQPLRRLINVKNLYKLSKEFSITKINGLTIPQLNQLRSLQTSLQNKSTRKGILPKLGLAIGVGLLIGGGYEVKKNLAAPDRKNRIVDEPDNVTKLIRVPEKIKPTRVVTGPLNDLGLSVTLYQFQSCPFCCKVRAFLEFYGIPFDVVEVHPVLKKEMQFSKSKKVPLMLIKFGDEEYEILNESSVIISILGTLLINPEKGLSHALKYYQPVKYETENGKTVVEYTNMYFLMFGEDYTKSHNEQIVEERKWRRWVDQELVHLISPNVYRTMEESRETFHHFSKRGQWEVIFKEWERNLAIYAGAFVMYLIGKRLKEKHHLKADVRESLYEACNKWTRTIGKERKFLGGKNPNLGDLAVFGVLNSMEGCRAFEDMFKETKIGPWYHSVQKHIESHSGSHLVSKKRPKNNQLQTKQI